VHHPNVVVALNKLTTKYNSTALVKISLGNILYIF